MFEEGVSSLLLPFLQRWGADRGCIPAESFETRAGSVPRTFPRAFAYLCDVSRTRDPQSCALVRRRKRLAAE